MSQATPALSRRNFLTQASCFGAFYHFAARVPLLGLPSRLADDARISAPIVDKGFASVRKIGDGLYATISDSSKGYVTVCNGGLLVGKDSALLLEGFATAAGAAFQMETLRTISQAPVKRSTRTITTITLAAIPTTDPSASNFGRTLRSHGACSIPMSLCSRSTCTPHWRPRKHAFAKPRVMWKNLTRKAISPQ